MNQNDRDDIYTIIGRWAVLASILMLLGVLMYGCTPRYQPPGEDLWRTIEGTKGYDAYPDIP